MLKWFSNKPLESSPEIQGTMAYVPVSDSRITALARALEFLLEQEAARGMGDSARDHARNLLANVRAAIPE